MTRSVKKQSLTQSALKPSKLASVSGVDQANTSPLKQGRTQAERTELSDQKMFEATVQLLIERGPENTRLTDVGIEAGYSRGLAGHRFGNKDRLFNFVVLRVGEIWLKKLKQATERESGLRAIECAIEQHYQFCVEAPDYVYTFYTLWFESINTDSELSRTIQSIHQRRFQDVVNWILNDSSISDSAKRDADSVAGQFSATVIGIIYYWLSNPDKLRETKRLHDGLALTMRRLIKG